MEHIEIDTGKRFGNPVIKDTRISVSDVMAWLTDGMSPNDIILDFPELNKEQIEACIKYTSDHDQRSNMYHDQ